MVNSTWLCGSPVSLYFPTQLGGLPVPRLPWLPVCVRNGPLQALERVGSPPPPDPVHPQGERHADAPQGLLRDDSVDWSPADCGLMGGNSKGLRLVRLLMSPWIFFNSHLAAQATWILLVFLPDGFGSMCHHEWFWTAWEFLNVTDFLSNSNTGKNSSNTLCLQTS